MPFAITAPRKNFVAYRTSKSFDLKIAIRRIGIGEHGRCHIRRGQERLGDVTFSTPKSLVSRDILYQKYLSLIFANSQMFTSSIAQIRIHIFRVHQCMNKQRHLPIGCLIQQKQFVTLSMNSKQGGMENILIQIWLQLEWMHRTINCLVRMSSQLQNKVP